MIVLTMFDSDREYAVEARKEREGLHDYFQRPGKDIRWTGLAVESVIDRWLTDVGIEHTWNGGVDGLPDFEIGNDPDPIFRTGLAAKNNNGEWRDDFEFIIPAQVAKRLDDQVMFTVFDQTHWDVYLAGVITNEQFLMHSRFARKGDPGPIRPFFNDCRIIRADQLIDVALWGRMMGGNL